MNVGLALYDTFQYIQSPIQTLCLGQAMSMGSLLLAAGAKGKRYILPNATVMIHQPSGGYSGVAEDIAIHAKEILRLRRRLNEIYMKHLTKPHTLGEIGKPRNAGYLGLGEREPPLHFISRFKDYSTPYFLKFQTHLLSLYLPDHKNSHPIAYSISNIRFPTFIPSLTCHS